MHLFIGIVLVVLGVLLRRNAKSRVFYRRNSQGIEEFDSYSNMELNRLFDVVLKFGGYVLILLGVVFIGNYLM